MKKSIFFLLLASCCSFSAAYAQKLIAVQHQDDASFFTTLQGAYTAAGNGDTIYIPGVFF